MKHFLLGAALATLMGSALAADVGVSVSIGQPGFYGRIDLGNAPQPRLIYAQPMIIQPPPIGYARQPIYLRVPPGHEKHWDKNCHKYNACGQPVYFVQDNWYRNEYVPAYRDDQGDRGDYRDRHEERGNHGRGHDKDKRNKGRGND
jgi:opacity protein-like surface antigen